MKVCGPGVCFSTADGQKSERRNKSNENTRYERHMTKTLMPEWAEKKYRLESLGGLLKLSFRYDDEVDDS